MFCHVLNVILNKQCFLQPLCYNIGIPIKEFQLFGTAPLHRLRILTQNCEFYCIGLYKNVSMILNNTRFHFTFL